MIDLFAHIFTLTFIVSVFRLSVPYALAALGGVMSERSGVVNIALEGKMLLGAFAAAVVAHLTGSVGVGALGGVLAGIAVGALYALCVIRMRANQIVIGVAINLLALALSAYLLGLVFGSTSNSPRTPGLGADLATNPLFWLSLILVGATHYLVFRTRYGLRLRAVGEHPEAAETLGVSVERTRWIAVLAAGALSGLAGSWLALANEQFVADMVNGRGYKALAAVIMGAWRPAAAAAACLLFGLADALKSELQAAAIGVPNELLDAFPYVLAIIVVCGFIGRVRAPAAAGKPHERG